MNDKQLQDATRMFEYVREDLKELREESRQQIAELGNKMDRVADALSRHDANDTKNFHEVFQRVSAIETVQATQDKTSDRSWTRWLAVLGLIVSFGTLVVMVMVKGS